MANLNIPKGTLYTQSHRNRNYDQVVKRTGQKFTVEELNYEGQISQFQKEGLYKDILGPMFIGDGFKVVAPAQVSDNNNSVVIKAGRLYTRLGEINLAEDKTYEQIKTEIASYPANYRDYIYKATYNDVEPTAAENMITTPTNSRTDVLVLVVTKLYTGTDIDPQIQSTSLGAASAYRYKLFYSFKIQKGATLANCLDGFVYEDDFIVRIPVAVISRYPGFPLIADTAIIDSRTHSGEVMTLPLYKKVLEYITNIQGSGKGFNADKVDGKDVDDSVGGDVTKLWTSQKVKDFVEARAKGILPERYILGYVKASEVPLNPAYGARYIISQANGVAPRDTLKMDCIYTYSGTGAFDGFKETPPEQGMFLVNQDTGGFMLYSEEALDTAGIYGYHWLDFGGIADHASLMNVLRAENSAEDTVLKHLTDYQYKYIMDTLAAEGSLITNLEDSLDTHINNPTLDHPDKSVTFSKIIDHTVIDSATLGTGVAAVDLIINRLATAIKILSGSANWQTGLKTKFNTDGGTISGITNITDTTETTTTDNGSFNTQGGASIKKGLRVGGDVNIGGSLLAGNIPPTQEVIGFSTANNASDPNNDIDFTTKNISVIFNHDLTQILRPGVGTMTKQLNANFVAGHNQGGLDTGTKTINTNYFLYIIWKADKTKDYIFSTNSTTPTLPTGFIYYRRLPGFVRVDASGNILGYIDEGDGKFTLKNRSLVYTGATTATRALHTTILPPYFRGDFNVSLYAPPVGVSYNFNLLCGNVSEADVAPTDQINDVSTLSFATPTLTSQKNNISKVIQVSASSQIYSRANYVQSANSPLTILVVGYYDNASL